MGWEGGEGARRGNSCDDHCAIEARSLWGREDADLQPRKTKTNGMSQRQVSLDRNTVKVGKRISELVGGTHRPSCPPSASSMRARSSAAGAARPRSAPRRRPWACRSGAGVNPERELGGGRRGNGGGGRYGDEAEVCDAFGGGGVAHFPFSVGRGWRGRGGSGWLGGEVWMGEGIDGF